ncbi:MFS transporter [Pacificitalea manganoxidans]|uniref:MFS transporter n=1 Tax=Pacificitalea manganoxidans TaxID=1411902 RepID=A0A291LZX2_9RHOB|nr:MFS transporter [Pacificitalea manganoxidans]ATI42015.1 MFS transporter [Pacificitalea manganoxidans]MAQ44974.1 MFS transporter [Actibacterium sp.]MDR6309510.1 MFS family permease [Pacificitalea manganoxidans]|tara:strand:+ start:978 stop:2288 length:1311 start_codon:yes stop_codon:yes gene_type:complete
MIQVLVSTWALLLGILLLLVGNGVQGTLLGVRGGIEGFSTLAMSIVMSGYFVGFLGGSRLAPAMIRRVGHIRVFAALGSMISAILILYPAFAHPISWTLGRILIGFCFSAVYVTAESWLNNSVDNANRGKALSLYMITQSAGIVIAQGLLVLGDPSGFILFVIPSVLVSISFTPILLSVAPTPAFATTKPMSLRQLYSISPLGCIGIFLLGGMYSAMLGMASVFGSAAGLSVAQISSFVAALYLGGLCCQFPIGWMSDRLDRRGLILWISVIGAAVSALGMMFGASSYVVLLIVAFGVGGMTNPLYALLIAYTNDYLDPEDMAAASGGLLFLNGLGAIAGPILTGWIMAQVGPYGFFLFIGLLMAALALYAAWRMTQRQSPSSVETVSYAPILPSATPVVAELVQEVFIENQEEVVSDAQDAAELEYAEREAAGGR